MTIFDRKRSVLELQKDRLIRVAQTYFPDVELSDNYIWGKLRAAEREIEKKLRVFLEPVVVLPETASQTEMDALDAAGTRWVEESGYDWSPELFQGNSWGFIITRRKPIISVDYIRFEYPISNTTIFTVPDQWIRLDKKYGHIRLLPVGTLVSAPLNSYIMSVMGGGQTVPHILMLRYTAGIKDISEEHPDIVDAIKKLAVLKIIADEFLPTSSSISADGLIESTSIDMDKHHAHIDKTIEDARDELQGIRMIAL